MIRPRLSPDVRCGLRAGRNLVKMLIPSALLAFVSMGVGLVYASDPPPIRRPPMVDTCDECPEPGTIGCEIAPDACAQCWDECGFIAGPPFVRVRPDAPYNDPRVNYHLPRLMGVVQLAYDQFYEKPVLQHWTTKEFLDILDDHNIRAVKLWFKGNPFDGSGKWSWETPWGTQQGPMGQDYVVAEDMDLIWEHRSIDVYVVRFLSDAWTIDQRGCGDSHAPVFANEPTYEIAKGLLERYGHYNKTIIIGNWEADWGIKGRLCRGLNDDGLWKYPWADASDWWSTACIDSRIEDGDTPDAAYMACGSDLIDQRVRWVARSIERRQRGIQRARNEFPLARLRILGAATVNHGPWNAHPDDPGIVTVTEMIPLMDPQPDLIGLSFWGTDSSITDALDWVQGITMYPHYRFFIDELGARSDAQQATRIPTETNLARCWGVKLVNIWMMFQTWCGEVRPNGSHRYEGIFYQQQPCSGKVIFDGPRPGFWALKDLIDEPFDQEQCGN